MPFVQIAIMCVHIFAICFNSPSCVFSIGSLAAATLLALTSMNLPAAPAQSLYELKVNSLAYKQVDLAQYKGHVVLVVNVASKCGFTKQYAGLEKLFLDYKDKGFFVLGFPSNDFGGQEPGTSEEIAAFCSSKYSASPSRCSRKSVTQGPLDQSPVYQFLTTRDFPRQAGTSANTSSTPTAKC